MVRISSIISTTKVYRGLKFRFYGHGNENEIFWIFWMLKKGGRRGGRKGREGKGRERKKERKKERTKERKKLVPFVIDSSSSSLLVISSATNYTALFQNSLITNLTKASSKIGKYSERT